MCGRCSGGFGFPMMRAEQFDSTRNVGEDCAPVDTLSAAPFAGAGAKTRSTIVNTGARDSDSAPAYARREPSQSRSEARCVRLARSSSAAALPGQAAQGHPVKRGATPGAAFFRLPFLAAQER